MITLIGTPPNGIFVRFVEQTYNEQVSFLEWLKISLPVGIGLLAATYIIMTKFLFRQQIDAIEGGRQWVSAELASLGKLSRGEKIVLTVFVCAALLWVFGPYLRALEIGGMKPLKPMSDAVIAMGAGIILFIIPVDYKKASTRLTGQALRKRSAGTCCFSSGAVSRWLRPFRVPVPHRS